MGLRSALVDRARVHRPAAQTLKVEGRTQFAESEPGEWFRCRLFLPTAAESYDPATVRRRVVIVPTMLYGLRDANGVEIGLTHTDRVEIDSNELGAEMWQAASEPEPIRKKRRLIGYQVTLRRVQTNEFEPKV